IYRLVRNYGRRAGIAKLTAHSLRASGITLMLEKNAPLWKVQDLAGHADPRTTRIYKKRKQDLDENAADVLNI
ncbi:MAG: tyrosine-type recombinase/integrase, partial [Ktedonobacteraceae bacterium]|nr:tyrosine-type recombinase/integrase [Ktedonobacteraceae bacterium]